MKTKPFDLYAEIKRASAEGLDIRESLLDFAEECSRHVVGSRNDFVKAARSQMDSVAFTDLIISSVDFSRHVIKNKAYKSLIVAFKKAMPNYKNMIEYEDVDERIEIEAELASRLVFDFEVEWQTEMFRKIIW